MIKNIIFLFCFKEQTRMRLTLDESQILWMGNSKSKPEGFMIPTHLKVLTVQEKPFVYTRLINPDDGERCNHNEIPCPHYNLTDILGTITCY